MTAEQVAAPPRKQPVLRLMTMPADTNPAGDIFGGWVMAQVDVAGGIAAMQRARGRVATVAVNSFLFKQPISVGDVVSFYVDIVKVGRTSITVDVLVIAERHPDHPVTVKVTEATLTYVALNKDGSKREIPEELVPGFAVDPSIKPEPIQNGRNRGPSPGRGQPRSRSGAPSAPKAPGKPRSGPPSAGGAKGQPASSHRSGGRHR